MIIGANGANTMYESYAAMQMADGLFSSLHVLMCAQNPVVVRFENGNIDPINSYVITNEQHVYGSRSTEMNYMQENGYEMRPLGTVTKNIPLRSYWRIAIFPLRSKNFSAKTLLNPVRLGWAAKSYRWKKIRIYH